MKVQFQGPLAQIREEMERFLEATAKLPTMEVEWECEDVEFTEDLPLCGYEQDGWKTGYPDLSKCPKCGGEADNGHDRCVPPSPYLCTRCSDD